MSNSAATAGSGIHNGIYATYPSPAIRVAVVSGGATALGAEFVTQLAQQGARVSFVDLQQEAGQALGEAVTAAGLPASGLLLRRQPAGRTQRAGRPWAAARQLGHGHRLRHRRVAGAPCCNREVIRPFDEQVLPAGFGTAVLRGYLCPGGAVVKQSAASQELLKRKGRTVVFDSHEAHHAVADDPNPNPDTEAGDVIVVRGAGPRYYPGMPEVSNVPMLAKLLRGGVTDMVRVSDGRMSGTSFGTGVLHVSPGAAVGGPIAMVQTGDRIILAVTGPGLTLDAVAGELARRRSAWSPLTTTWADSGCAWFYTQHVLKADQGADRDFLRGTARPRRAARLTLTRR